jgi:hypothetical protein
MEAPWEFILIINGRHDKSHGRATKCEEPTVNTVRGRIQKFPDWVRNEINNNYEHSLRSKTKGYGGKTH